MNHYYHFQYLPLAHRASIKYFHLLLFFASSFSSLHDFPYSAIFFQSPPRGLGVASLTTSLEVPIQSLSENLCSIFSKCVTYPSPFWQIYIVCHEFKIAFFIQIVVADDVWPAHLENTPQASVAKALNLSSKMGSYMPGFTSIKQYRDNVGRQKYST